jgi:dihydroneopterin aldolase
MAGGRGDLAPPPRKKSVNRTPAVIRVREIAWNRVPMDDRLQLRVLDLEVSVLTGIYSEETHLPQPLRISVRVDIDCPDRFDPDTPLSASKNYMDLKHAVTTALPEGRHFTLVEAIADHIFETLMVQDTRVRCVEVEIVKIAIAEAGESIGISLVRHRR